MGPKVHAAIRFLKNGGRRVVITTPELAAEALEPAADGTLRVGTTIVLSDSLAAANP
jgi:carbamate kinase